MAITQEDVFSALKQCYDPEIPVNIVDLGLIYDIRCDDVPEGQQDVTVEMTLTSQGCPEHVNISAQVKSRLEQLPGIRNANVNVVWTPAWTPERLSPTPASNSASSNADFSFRAFGEYSPALHPKFFEDPRRAAPPRRVRNALPGASRHFHHAHAAIKIIRQRPPHPLKFIRILRRKHRQRHSRRQHSRRISP